MYLTKLKKIVIASGIFNGCIKPTDKKFSVAGIDVKIPAADYVYKDTDIRFDYLMRCLYSASNPPYLFPTSGGYMEQDPYFLEALEIFRAAPHKFKAQKEMNHKALQKLGAIK